MNIRAGDVARTAYFKAVDITDLHTPETSLSNAAVWYSIDGGNQTSMTTPTITHIANGVFKLAIDEAGMVALAAGVDSAELVLHISADEMDPVDLSLNVFRNKTPHVWHVTPAALGGSDSNSGCCYDEAVLTINHAISVAAAGDTIKIWPGTFDSEAVVINKANLTLEGASWGAIITIATVVAPPNAVPTVTIAANNVTLRNLSIKHTGTSAATKDCIAIRCTINYELPVIENCYIESTDVCCYLDSDGYWIKGCSMKGAEYAVYSNPASAPKYGYTIEDCSMYLAGWTVCNAASIYIVGYGKVLIQNVKVYDNITSADSTHQCQGIALSGSVYAVLNNVVIKTVTGNSTYESGLHVGGGGPALASVVCNNVLIHGTPSATNSFSIKVLTGCHCVITACKYDTAITSGTILHGDSGLSQGLVSDGVIAKAAKVIVNKAIQNKTTGVVQYYDDDGVTLLHTVTPADGTSTITRTPS